jgi:hypothetical protein
MGKPLWGVFLLIVRASTILQCTHVLVLVYLRRLPPPFNIHLICVTSSPTGAYAVHLKTDMFTNYYCNRANKARV